MERESRSLTPFLVDLLERWSAGAVTPSEVMRAAAERWEPTAWPDLADDDPANAPIVVLELLAHARAWGLAADEVPTLLAILRSTGGNPYERLVEQMAAIDTGTRDLLLRSGYYGPGTEEDPPAWEDGWRDPEQRRLHRGVHQDPDSVWVDARARICAEPADFAAHLLDDLLVNHADAFADRIIDLADECPGAKLAIATVHTGDKPDTPAVWRFETVRRRLEDELVAAGEISVWVNDDDDRSSTERGAS